MADNDDLLDYEDEEQPEQVVADGNVDGGNLKKDVKGTYVSIHSSGFRDFLLKPEILRAIVDCGFEHPSEVQHECIPQAVLGMDILCQAKSGMGKTAVFVLATLQQLEPTENQVYVLVMCHTRELAFQISKEYERFSKYMPLIKVGVFFGGLPIQKDEEVLKNNCPHIVVGTPGRILALVRSKKLNLKHLKHFILDECDKMLELLDMRRDVQEIYRNTPHGKQVMMFSATLSKEIRPVCKKFMQDPMEVYVDDEAKLTLHGLQQHYVKLKENEKNKKLFELLDVLEFNQVVIFVKSVQRCMALAQLLTEQNFPAIGIHRGMSQEERLSRYQQFKDFQKRILVATNLFGRGMDIERVNIVFNYDMPEDSDTYLHRVARAGRFGTKGLAITFVSEEGDAKILNEVQDRFDVNITELPDEIDLSSYSEVFEVPDQYTGAGTPDMVTLKHPNTNKPAMFLFSPANNSVQEILTFSEAKRSWFIDESVLSDGKMHLSTPIDPIFLVLPYLRKHCTTKAVPLDHILRDEDFPETERLLKSSGLKYINLIADKKGDDDLNAYKYNEEKTLQWLQKKTERVADILKQKNIHVGSGAVSATFVKSSKTDQLDESYLRYAHGIVSEYLMDDLSKKLLKQLGLPEESSVQTLSAGNKRRSTSCVSPGDTKKLKTDIVDLEPIKNGALDLSGGKIDLKTSKTSISSKEKARAKAASGSKSISMFFSKK